MRGKGKKSLLARFWEKVEKTDGCWNWVGATHRQGYGLIRINGINVLAHRLAWELTRGPLAREMDVLHSCDSPACVRPDHLFLGGQTDNNRDRDAKGRQAQGTRNGNAKLTADQVRAALAEIDRGGLSVRGLAKSFNVSDNTLWYHFKKRRAGFNYALYR